MFASGLRSLYRQQPLRAASRPVRRSYTDVSGINKVILVGTVEGKAKVYTFDNGSVAAFTMSTFDTWNDKHTGSPIELVNSHRRRGEKVHRVAQSNGEGTPIFGGYLHKAQQGVVVMVSFTHQVDQLYMLKVD